MPPRPIKVYHIQVKTHKLTIVLSGLAPGTMIADMKSEVLSALKTEKISDNALDFMAMDPPQISVESEDDFELCRAIKERGKPTGTFEVLDPSKLLKDNGLSGWEIIFLQFRDRSSGDLLPITYTLPPMYDEEDELPQANHAESSSAETNKRKRARSPSESEQS
ncbi:hypothetical protein BYT27DRAFT_7191450 [Phlegmacium glaucopus]|nr:hypothetical protein BYT27DRAFT_7191450 [Phlegmacium glaucopus]